jgi:Flp pilus assembly pilin Flp
MVIGRIALQDEKAQTMVEYGLIMGLVTLAVIGTVSLLSDAVLAMFQRIFEAVSNAA